MMASYGQLAGIHQDKGKQHGHERQADCPAGTAAPADHGEKCHSVQNYHGDKVIAQEESGRILGGAAMNITRTPW